MRRITRQRETRHTYEHPGSWERVVVAALDMADASAEDDLDYHGRMCRFRAAVNAYADRRAAEKAREALQGGSGSTIGPGPMSGRGSAPCAVPAAACGFEAQPS